MDTETRLDRLTGCLLGTAVGDALGLPREGLARRRAARVYGAAPLRYRFLLGRGMISDDTEHTCLTAQALLAGNTPEQFGESLAWRLRGWLLGLPAGVGLATLRAIGKLWLGWSPKKSGVHSAGNGPAMRAAILGVYFDDRITLEDYVAVSTLVTHTDPRAVQGAQLIALAAWWGSRHGSALDQDDIFTLLDPVAGDPGLRENLRLLREHLQRGEDAEMYANALGLAHGVTGFINHTVPVALYCWLRYPTDFRRAVEAVILLGGDADTTGAIVGGLMGATLGADAIPREWLDGLAEWPRSVAWMRQLGGRLADAAPPLPLSWWGIPARNLLFTLVVLFHGFRRLLPPY